MESRVRVQTEIVVDGMSFVLAADEDLERLERLVHDAVSAGGRFVRFALAGHRYARVLITAASRVAMITEQVVDEEVPRAISLNDEGNWDLL